MIKNPPLMQETQVQSLDQEDSPEEGNGYPLQHSCLGNPMDRWSLAGYSPWGHIESDTTDDYNPFTFSFNGFQNILLIFHRKLIDAPPKMKRHLASKCRKC